MLSNLDTLAPNAHLLHNVDCIGRSGAGVNVIFIRLIEPPRIQPMHKGTVGAQSREPAAENGSALVLCSEAQYAKSPLLTALGELVWIFYTVL